MAVAVVLARCDDLMTGVDFFSVGVDGVNLMEDEADGVDLVAGEAD